jgi:ABC-type microcin C transport system permease subunit YejB
MPEPVSGTRRDSLVAMKALLAALAIWTTIAFLILLFDPGGALTVEPCMRLISRTAACEARMQELNDGYWFRHTLPLILVALSGYVAIGIVKLRGARTI